MRGSDIEITKVRIAQQQEDLEMKVRSAFLLIALPVFVIGLVACGPQAAEEPEEAMTQEWPDVTDLGGRDIVVGTDNAWPPWAYIDNETGQPTGYDYELFDEICKRANCVPVFKVFSWDGFFEAGQAGEWDISCWGITHTLERSKLVDYSDPIIEYGAIILTRADDDRVHSLDDVINSDVLLGGAPASTEYLTSVDLVGEDRVVAIDADLMIPALLAGDYDAMVFDETGAYGVMTEYPDQMRIAARVTSGEYVALPMRPGWEGEVAIQAALNEMWADGTLVSLQNKWFPGLGEE